jgi:hypothetical protein
MYNLGVFRGSAATLEGGLTMKFAVALWMLAASFTPSRSHSQ